MADDTAGDSMDQNETPETPAEDTTPRSFSEADVNRIVQDRLKRQREQFAGHDEYREKAAKYDEHVKASQTELERFQAENQQLKEQIATAAQREREIKLRIAVVSAAAERKVVDPDGAYALLDKSSIEFDEDGSPLNIAPAMDQLLEAKPYLVSAGGTRGSADQGARQPANTAGQLSRADLQNMTSAEIVQAQKEGRLQDVLSGKA